MGCEKSGQRTLCLIFFSVLLMSLCIYCNRCVNTKQHGFEPDSFVALAHVRTPYTAAYMYLSESPRELSWNCCSSSCRPDALSRTPQQRRSTEGNSSQSHQWNILMEKACIDSLRQEPCKLATNNRRPAIYTAQ